MSSIQNAMYRAYNGNDAMQLNVVYDEDFQCYDVQVIMRIPVSVTKPAEYVLERISDIVSMADVTEEIV